MNYRIIIILLAVTLMLCMANIFADDDPPQSSCWLTCETDIWFDPAWGTFFVEDTWHDSKGHDVQPYSMIAGFDENYDMIWSYITEPWPGVPNQVMPNGAKYVASWLVVTCTQPNQEDDFDYAESP